MNNEKYSEYRLSTCSRSSLTEKLENRSFDLVIIGGGVTGAGIALDAASRGLKTALVEMGDFASGTSSRSTKLIHGGLRYLKQFEFGLVAEVGRERAIVHKNAPHLVIPEKMLLPLIKGGNYGKFGTSMGLKVYDILAQVKKEDRRVMLSAKETLDKEPLLDKHNLIGGGYYAEYRTDDARLTVELLKTAAELGAVCMNYCEVNKFNYHENRISGVSCGDNISGEEININAKFVINAAGPWVDTLRDMVQSKHSDKKKLHLTKGIHIVVPKERFPVKQSLYFDISDGRMIFAIPRGKCTYIGTTDTDYFGELGEVKAERVDIEYLINAVNSTFPDIELSFSDIESTWAGLRPLIHEEGKSASEISRKNEVFESPDGLISIAGGKLTGYRKMAQKITYLVIKKIRKKSNVNFKSSKTKRLKLTGGPFASRDEVKRFTLEIEERLSGNDLSKGKATFLVSTYGKQTSVILDCVEKQNETLNETTLILSELCFTVENEMVTSSCDFFIRRTARLYFDIQSVSQNMELVSGKLSELLSWTEEQKKQDIKELKAEIEKATCIRIS